MVPEGLKGLSPEEGSNDSRRKKQVHEGSTIFKKDQEGSRGLGRYKKVQEGSERFKKVHECLRRDRRMDK